MASISNAEIIHNEVMLAGLDPSKDYKTFSQWKFRGMSVKKGEHAVIKTGLWTPCKASKKELADNPNAQAKCYLKTSFLFSNDQVEPMKQSQAAG